MIDFSDLNHYRPIEAASPDWAKMTRTFAQKMMSKTTVLCWLLLSPFWGCSESDVSVPRSNLTSDPARTNQALVEIAQTALTRRQEWTDPVKTDPETKDSRPVSLFGAPPPKSDEEHLFRSVIDGNDLVVFIHRYGPFWRAWVAVFDGETETTVFDGQSLETCLDQVREAYAIDKPLCRNGRAGTKQKENRSEHVGDGKTDPATS